jgi:hypothetical protein
MANSTIKMIIKELAPSLSKDNKEIEINML